MKLSVLVPVYNEAGTLKEITEKILRLDVDKEIIIVDDGSVDGTKELIQDKYDNYQGIKVLRHSRNLGKGAAVRTALDNAAGEYSIIQDADLEYNPGDYIIMLEAAKKQGSGAVYGSRFLRSWQVTSLWHFLANKLLTAITNLLFDSHLTDMETCYKMIRTDIFKNLSLECSRFDIEAEITAKLLKEGIKITEVPVSYKGRSFHEGKKITWKDGIATLWTLFKYRFLQ